MEGEADAGEALEGGGGDVDIGGWPDSVLAVGVLVEGAVLRTFTSTMSASPTSD